MNHWTDNFKEQLHKFMAKLPPDMMGHKCAGVEMISHHDKLLATAIGVALSTQNGDDFKVTHGVMTLAHMITREDVDFAKGLMKKVADNCPVCASVLPDHNVFDEYEFIDLHKPEGEYPLPPDPWPKGDSFAA